MEAINFKALFPKRKQDTYKGDYGHVIVLGGSVGFTGAACLCAEAALISGCGLVTLGIPSSLNIAMEAKLTEVMTKPLPETQELTLSPLAEEEILEMCKSVDAVALGPGLSINPQTQRLIKKIVLKLNAPMVIDADGLNALSGDSSVLGKIKPPCVITPHPGEMSRLAGVKVEEVQSRREEFAKKFAKKFSVIVALKGAGTVVVNPKEEVYINNTGNPGMATAGSGDVLTGIIAGFIAQKIEIFSATKAAVFIHGLAGDIAAKEKGEISLIARDILGKIPEAIKQVLA